MGDDGGILAEYGRMGLLVFKDLFTIAWAFRVRGLRSPVAGFQGFFHHCLGPNRVREL